MLQLRHQAGAGLLAPLGRQQTLPSLKSTQAHRGAGFPHGVLRRALFPFGIVHGGGDPTAAPQRLLQAHIGADIGGLRGSALIGGAFGLHSQAGIDLPLGGVQRSPAAAQFGYFALHTGVAADRPLQQLRQALLQYCRRQADLRQAGAGNSQAPTQRQQAGQGATTPAARPRRHHPP